MPNKGTGDLFMAAKWQTEPMPRPSQTEKYFIKHLGNSSVNVSGWPMFDSYATLYPQVLRYARCVSLVIWRPGCLTQSPQVPGLLHCNFVMAAPLPRVSASVLAFSFGQRVRPNSPLDSNPSAQVNERRQGGSQTPASGAASGRAFKVVDGSGCLLFRNTEL